MIERVLIKDALSFKEVELNFDKNLIVFSGASGTGKSVLINSIIGLFGFKDLKAKMIEASLDISLDLGDYGIENDDVLVFKSLQNNKRRYFINSQTVSKKNLKEISTKFVEYLNLKEFKEFDDYNILLLLDGIILKSNKGYQKHLDKFTLEFKELESSKKELALLEEKQSNITQLKEFTEFEIEKIDSISPKIGEYEKLIVEKRDLSSKEKISEAITEASEIFNFENRVNEFLSLIEVDSTFFDEAINELRVVIEKSNEKLEELEDVDIETLLDRIEKLSSLNSRYGSIQEALKYREKKAKELESFENLELSIKNIKQKIDKLEVQTTQEAIVLSRERHIALKKLSDNINSYLDMLYLSNLEFEMSESSLHKMGKDTIRVNLSNTSLDAISSGEFNRVRLAMLACRSKFLKEIGGVLILDEIDANLSGKESMGVAKVLKFLSKNYQIFAISHQPQLASYGDMHFLVTKNEQRSEVIEIRDDKRINEIARMISGDKISKEAIDFAKSLMKEGK